MKKKQYIPSAIYNSAVAISIWSLNENPLHTDHNNNMKMKALCNTNAHM